MWNFSNLKPKKHLGHALPDDFARPASVEMPDVLGSDEFRAHTRKPTCRQPTKANVHYVNGLYVILTTSSADPTAADA
jgi:hypothetical protein